MMKLTYFFLSTTLSLFVFLNSNPQVDAPREQLHKNEKQVYKFLLTLSDSVEEYPDLFQNVMEHVIRANTIEVYSFERPDLYFYDCIDVGSSGFGESQEEDVDNKYSSGEFFYPFNDVGNNDSSYCSAINTIEAPVVPYIANKKELLKIRAQSIVTSQEFLESIYSLKRHATDHLQVMSSFTKSDGSSTTGKRNLNFWRSDLIQTMLSENLPQGTGDLYELSGDFYYENPEYYVRIRTWNAYFGMLNLRGSSLNGKDLVTGPNTFAEEINTALKMEECIWFDVEIRQKSSGSGTFYNAGFLL